MVNEQKSHAITMQGRDCIQLLTVVTSFPDRSSQHPWHDHVYLLSSSENQQGEEAQHPTLRLDCSPRAPSIKVVHIPEVR